MRPSFLLELSMPHVDEGWQMSLKSRKEGKGKAKERVKEKAKGKGVRVHKLL
jgi:hypothetical protein